LIQGKTIFIFIGPPGAGKGSLSRLCVKKLGWSQLSTGDLCRKHMSEGTKIGKCIDFAMKSGKLVADGLVVEMVDQWLSSRFTKKDAVILDGFPRTVPQAEAFGELLHKKFKLSNVSIIRMCLDDEKVVERLTGRFICKNDTCQEVYSVVEGSSLAPKVAMVCDECSCGLVRRADDSEHFVRDRLETYHRHEGVLLDFYRRQGQEVKDFFVDKALSSVFREFKAFVGLGDE